MGYPYHRFIVSYVHHGRVGVLVEFGSESDFATRTPEFQRLSTDIAMQIAALNPPDVAGLLKQVFVKDQTVTVETVLARAIEELKEKIVVRRFIRWDDEDPSDRPQPPENPAQAVRLGKR